MDVARKRMNVFSCEVINKFYIEHLKCGSEWVSGVGQGIERFELKARRQIEPRKTKETL